MHLSTKSLLGCAAVLATAASAAVPSAPSRALLHRRGGGGADAKPTAIRRRRREISAEDGLDILRLGFIPPGSRDCERDGESSSCSAIDEDHQGGGGMVHFGRRGGGIDDEVGSDKKRIPSRDGRGRLSTEDQLDILRLGFIPVNRGGGLDSDEDDLQKGSPIIGRLLPRPFGVPRMMSGRANP